MMKIKFSKLKIKSKRKFIFVLIAFLIVATASAFYLTYSYRADELAPKNTIENIATVSYKDSSGSTITFQSNKVSTEIIEESGNTIPTDAYDTGWNMISFSQIRSNTDKNIIPNTYKIREYDPKSNKYTDPSTLAPGKGYWIKVDNISALQEKKYPIDQPNTISLSVTKGWNLLGNPFSSNLNIDKIVVIMKDGTKKSLQQAKDDKKILDYFWSYEKKDKAYLLAATNPNKFKTSAKKQNFLAPYRGFWFYVKSDDVASIEMSK